MTDTQPAMALLTGQEQDDILKARLATDEKYLRRLTKRITTVAQAASDEEHNAAVIMLKSDLDLFCNHLNRLQATSQSTTQREIEAYDSEAAALHASCEEERKNIARLKKELEAAQQTRQNRIEYDELARKIVVYPSREDMESTLQSLQERVAALKQENESFSSITAETRSGLDAIVAQLQKLHESIDASLRQAPVASGPAEADADADGGEPKTQLNPNVPSFTPQTHAAEEPAGNAKRVHAAPETTHAAPRDQPEPKRLRKRE
ncbi:uncharacterized protein MJAP1_000803 [Malassezia japonica]|uniref:THO complex subunit 7 n=1 Tax=Malassezia japonica TaxID=223818 RepID=A0AAF0F118_9BASI|nr:uncharacterized protein MJAP1_000803 [Malassezia japonica]WFD37856.1 hypothetical protein MJAP1_000803 [Malassezia japonica]